MDRGLLQDIKNIANRLLNPFVVRLVEELGQVLRRAFHSSVRIGLSHQSGHDGWRTSPQGFQIPQRFIGYSISQTCLMRGHIWAK